ncbi:Protein-tyrosine kinase 6 [Manis javanica]|nr:Protein-tyrosine kinase 6 [Manis javanica]
MRLDAVGRALAEGYVPHNYPVEEETVESEPPTNEDAWPHWELDVWWGGGPAFSTGHPIAAAAHSQPPAPAHAAGRDPGHDAASA